MRSELTTDWKRQFNNYSNFGFGLQYTFSEKSYLSLAYSGNIEDLGGVVESRNAITNNTSRSFYATDIDKNDVLLNQFVNLNYNLITDKKGSSLFIAGQYSDFNGKVNDFIEENGIVNEETTQKVLKNIVGNATDIFTVQADFSKKISEKDKLDAGAKFSYADVNSGTDFLTSENSNSGFEPNEELSSDFIYQEKIKALYFNYGRTFSEKLDVSFGVRSEWTNYNLATTARGNQQFEKRYSNFFPNLLLNFSITENLKGHFSYVARITRPRYQALNPYVIYQDPFTTIEGNPNLLPEKTHAFEIGVMYKKFDFKLGYTYKIDPISGAALR
jgi:outer membrane receptor protein involved in Fe transport